MKLNQAPQSLIEKIEYSKNIQKITNNPYFQKFVSVYSNPKNLAPILTLEIATIAGRSVVAHKRGGWYELKERVFDEISTSIVWLYGVKILNTVADRAAEKFFKVNTRIDWKDPLKDFSFKRGAKFKNRLVAAKLAKMIFSVGTSLYLVGSTVPKINQWWTRILIANDYKDYLTEEQQMKLKKFHSFKGMGRKVPEAYSLQAMTSGEKLSSIMSSVPDKSRMAEAANSTSKISFKNGGLMGAVEAAGYLLDHNAIAQTFVIDLGLTAGRAAHARNGDESLEILYRDLVSVFFYSFCVPLLNVALAKKFDHKASVNTRLHVGAVDPVNTFILKAVKDVEHKQGQPLSLDQLKNLMLGNQNPHVKDLTNSLKARGIQSINLNTLNKHLLSSVLYDSGLATAHSVQDNYKMITHLIKELRYSPHELSGELQKFGKNIADGYLEKNVRTLYNLIDDTYRSDKVYNKKLYQLDRVVDAYRNLADTTLENKFKNYAEFIYKKLNTHALSENPDIRLSKYFTLEGKLVSLENREGLLKAIDGILKQNPVIAIKMLSEDLYSLTSHGEPITDKHLIQLDQALSKLHNFPKQDEIQELRSSIQNIYSLGEHQTITLKELENVLHNGVKGTHEFHKLVRKLHNPSPDPKSLLETKEIETFSQSVDTHLERLFDTVKNKVGQSTTKISSEDLLNLMNAQKNRQFLLKASYITSGLLVSGFFLSYIIPKTQTLMTYMRTGKKDFPGVKGLIPDTKHKKRSPEDLSIQHHNKNKTPKDLFISFEKK